MPPKNMTKARFAFIAENGETWEEIKELTDAEVTSLKEELEGREEYARVVRCKYCKNSEHWYRDRRRCFLWSEDGIAVFEDGFCNYGGRKDG